MIARVLRALAEKRRPKVDPWVAGLDDRLAVHSIVRKANSEAAKRGKSTEIHRRYEQACRMFPTAN